jgi:hypothetical protein
MKRSLLSLSFMIALLLGITVSCDLFDNVLDINFDTDYVEVTFTVNPSEAGPYTFTQEILQSDLQQQIEDNGGSIGNLKSVNIKEVVIEVASAGRDLNAFDQFDVFMSAASIDEIKVASVGTIPDGATSAALQIEQSDVKKFLNEDEYTVKISGELGEAITEPINLVAKIKYEVTVGP